jgi:aryl sulfotransferase
MTILQSGMEKSGNYWLWKVIQSALRESGRTTHTFIETQPIHVLAKTWELSFTEQADIDVLDIENDGLFYRISAIFRMPLLDIDRYLQQATHVWTHSFYCQRSDTVFPKFDKVVYIIRDPRDVALSMNRFQFTPYMQTYYPGPFESPEDHLQKTFRRYMQRWTRHVADHLRHAQRLGIYILFYERLLRDFDAELTALLHYLEIEPTPERITAIRRAVDFETMHAENPGHVRQGKAYGWAKHLTKEYQAQAITHAGGLLRLLNYPMDASQLGTLPALPQPLSLAGIDAATAPPPPGVRQRAKNIVKKLLP